MPVNYQVATQFVASQVVLSSIELVSTLLLKYFAIFFNNIHLLPSYDKLYNLRK
jgi:hypothetical protein